MEDRVTRRNTGIFIALFLLCGLIHYFMRKEHPYIPDTVLFCVTFTIYASLILFWIQTVRDRLVRSISRGYTLAAALMMLLFLVLQTLKYRIEVSPFFTRLMWYLFYVPMITMPTLFLMTCIRFHSGKDSPLRDTAFLAPAGLLAGIVLTNDLHHLVFVPKIDPALLSGDTGSYSYGPLYWVICAWIGMTIVPGIFFLLWKVRGWKDWKRGLWPVLFIAALPLVTVFNDLLEARGYRKLYNMPETYIFSMLGVFEACIRSRLMPRNENYPEFFSRMGIPAMITDRNLVPVYSSAPALDVSQDRLRRALAAPQALDEDTRLFGKTLSGACAFWAVDESTLHRLNDRLEETNETIGLENQLIRYENEQQEEKARIDARNAVYAKAAKELYPVHKKIGALLGGMKPGTPGFRSQLARVCAYNAFVKRKTNFILTYTETDAIETEELYLAIREVTGFLNDCGVSASIDRQQQGILTYSDTMALYDGFLQITEELMPRITRMMLFLRKNSLLMTVDCRDAPSGKDIPCAVSSDYSDGLLYLTLTAEGGGKA